MATVNLEGVHRVTAKGRIYYYAWRGKGAPRLKGEPGSIEFAESLEAARTPSKGGEAGKITALCARYRARDWWKNAGEDGCIAASTKKNWARWLDEIQSHFGPLRVAQFDRPEIRKDIRKWRGKWAETPRAADMAKQVLSSLLALAVEEGELSTNPCAGISNLYSADRSDIIWQPEDLEKLAAKASPEIARAARLGALTGIRQGDLLRLAWGRVGDLAIEIKTGKGRGKRTALVPLYAELSEYLGTLPRNGLLVLTNTDGDPWKTGFSSSWNKALKAAKITGLHFHDLRGTAATRMFVGGLTLREIAQTMGWSEERVERLIERYVSKEELLKDRIRRLDENARRTEAVKPDVKPSG
jgi:integrase